MWAANQSNVQKTVDCVAFLVKTVGDKIDVLEVMNEPAGFLGDDFTNVLRQYYIDTYGVIRANAGNMGVMLSDGFRGLDVSTPADISLSNSWLNSPHSIGEIPSTLLNTNEHRWT